MKFELISAHNICCVIDAVNGTIQELNEMTIDRYRGALYAVSRQRWEWNRSTLNCGNDLYLLPFMVNKFVYRRPARTSHIFASHHVYIGLSVASSVLKPLTTASVRVCGSLFVRHRETRASRNRNDYIVKIGHLHDNCFKTKTTREQNKRRAARM